MEKEEKLDKDSKDFYLLPEDKQNYVLGILQALVFASDTAKEEKSETANSGVKFHDD